MNKKNLLFTLYGIIVVSILCTSIIVSVNANDEQKITNKQKEVIGNAFDEIKEQRNDYNLRQFKGSNFVVNSDKFNITLDDFSFYKSNVLLITQLNNLKESNSLTVHEIPSDKELVDNLIMKELTIQYGKDQGIVVSKEEVEQVIEYEKNILYDPLIEGENKEIVKEIMDQRIKLTGLSFDDYWNSNQVYNEYEKLLYIDKLYYTLIDSKVINDVTDFENFQKEILDKGKKDIEITLQMNLE